MQEIYEQVYKETGNCSLSDENMLIKVGNPITNILSTAREGDYDLVVMGRHGHGKIGQALVGSVVGEVLRNCEKPVLTVRLQ